MSESTPKPLVGTILGAATLVVAALTLYVYLLHERDHDKADYMSLVAAWGLFFVTVALVVWAVVRNLTDAKRGESLRAQIVTLKDEHKTQIEALERRHTQEIEKKRLSLFEELRAQYPTEKLHINCQERIDNAEAELSVCREKLASAEDKNRQLLNSLAVLEKKSAIPQLIIEHFRKYPADSFTLTNEGPGAVQHIKINDIVMTKVNNISRSDKITQTLNLSSLSSLGILREKKDVECDFVASTNDSGAPLFNHLRAFLQDGWTPVFSVVIDYDDMGTGKYSRRFTLGTDLAERIAIEADPVTERA